MSSKKDKTPINKRPIICVNLEYYDSPDEALLEELYNCVLEELTEKDGVLSISLYEQFSYDKLMLVVFCKNACDAASLVRSKSFRKVREMFVSRDFVFDCSLLDYLKGDPDEGLGGD